MVFKFLLLLTSLSLGLNCTMVNQQQNKPNTNENYPVVIEASPVRAQAAEDAWNQMLSAHQLAFVRPELEPILYTPRQLPPAIANQLNIKPADMKADEVIDEAQAKEFLRRFIETYPAVLVGDKRSNALGLTDLSLIAFSADGNFYRAQYRQLNYPYPIDNGYGELRIVVSKTGRLLQLNSRLLTPVEMTQRPILEASSLIERFIGREFTYSNIAGQPLSYKVAQASEVTVKELVIFPKMEQQKLALHIAYPVEVGRGTTWTVYIDAVTGEEVEIKQNFQS